MSKLEKAIISLSALRTENRDSDGRDPRAVSLVTLLYLVALLSVPLTSVASVLWFGIYPIIASTVSGEGYGRVLKRSLVVLPFIALIGIFNPILDRSYAFSIGDIPISQGWVTFVSIVLRGLWAVQAVLAMTSEIGFNGFCRGLRGLGCPKFLTTQLMMVFRYLIVLLEEALRMRRARESRGFGRTSMPLKMWGTMIGELFVRTIDRSEIIHNAMMARGFTGEIPYLANVRGWKWSETCYLVVWSAIFLMLRFVSPDILFASLAR